MCQITIKPFGAVLNMDHIKKAAESNTDGYGVAAYGPNTDKRFKIFKTFNVDKYIDWIEKHNKKENSLLCHARYTTKGENSIDNIHPFYSKKHKFMFAHNGTFHGFGDDTISDSRAWLSEILNPLPVGFYSNKGIRQLLSKQINSSRICIMTTEMSWFWGDWKKTEDNCYQSNHWHERTRPGYGSTSVWSGNKKDNKNNNQQNIPYTVKDKRNKRNINKPFGKDTKITSLWKQRLPVVEGVPLNTVFRDTDFIPINLEDMEFSKCEMCNRVELRSPEEIVRETCMICYKTYQANSVVSGFTESYLANR